MTCKLLLLLVQLYPLSIHEDELREPQMLLQRYIDVNDIGNICTPFMLLAEMWQITNNVNHALMIAV